MLLLGKNVSLPLLTSLPEILDVSLFEVLSLQSLLHPSHGILPVCAHVFAFLIMTEVVGLDPAVTNYNLILT